MAVGWKSKLGLASFAAAWVAAVAAGMVVLLDYGGSPAEAGSPALQWPAGSALGRREGRITLVMLAHPQCPCTRASLAELAAAAAQTDGWLDIHIVFLSSPAFELHGDLWHSALEIPGATLSADPDGAEIRRFGVKASGHVLMYGPAGQLAYSGGITGSRGHAGGNRGREAIVELARHGSTALARFPVFGCALQSLRAGVSAAGGISE